MHKWIRGDEVIYDNNKKGIVEMVKRDVVEIYNRNTGTIVARLAGSLRRPEIKNHPELGLS